MKNAVVVSVSVGTALLLFLLAGLVVAGVAFVTIGIHQPAVNRDVYRPKTGAIGDIEKQINDLKYGQVNLEASKEVKNGLFSRLRARRVVSQPAVQTCQGGNCSTVTYSTPVVIQTKTIAQPVRIEQPFVAPINPLENVDATDCASGNCRKSPRSEVKTGSFICSNCRRSQVGDWHTDWRPDGTPITFLCESCYQKMTPDQRAKAYQGYAARQSKNVGPVGLLHQEISHD